MRIDLNEICKSINYEKLIEYAYKMNIKNNIFSSDYYNFINKISNSNTQLKIFTT